MDHLRAPKILIKFAEAIQHCDLAWERLIPVGILRVSQDYVFLALLNLLTGEIDVPTLSVSGLLRRPRACDCHSTRTDGLLCDETRTINLGERRTVEGFHLV